MSVRRSAGPLVRPLVGRSVGWSVGNLFFWRAETKTANNLFCVYELVFLSYLMQYEYLIEFNNKYTYTSDLVHVIHHF